MPGKGPRAGWIFRLCSSDIAAHLRERKDGARHWLGALSSRAIPKISPMDSYAVIAEEPIYCRHIHLCIQSGSNRVLALMNRKYTKEYFLGLVDTMKAAIPGLSLSTDILVGFPGETEEDLEETLDVMRKVRFSYSFMYHFNPREGNARAWAPGTDSRKGKKSQACARHRPPERNNRGTHVLQAGPRGRDTHRGSIPPFIQGNAGADSQGRNGRSCR